MSEKLPLFPLGTVLYPGLLLPLHIFEERYRHLVRDLLAGPEPPSFGVVAIREGRETGIDGVSALFQVGCTAVLRQVQRYPDGRYDIVSAAFGGYLRALGSLAEHDPARDAAPGTASPGITVPDLPAEPVALSYAV